MESNKEGCFSKADCKPLSRKKEYPNKGGENVKKKITTISVIMVLIASMNAGMTEAFLGDINRDGRVDVTDLGILGQAWNSHKGYPHYNACADLNKDGTIDSGDLAILGKHWGEEKKFVKTFILSKIIVTDSKYQPLGIGIYYLVADLYIDKHKNVNYWELWLRKAPHFPNCSEDIFVGAIETIRPIRKLMGFLNSIDYKQLLIDK